MLQDKEAEALLGGGAARVSKQHDAGKLTARERIDAALQQLPPDYRMAVTLADIEGLSYKEIAEVMECPIGTVMSRIYRGRKRLHELLYEHARELGYVDEADGGPGERETERARKRRANADEAVDLAAWRDRYYREKLGVYPSAASFNAGSVRSW